jgi:hypothetical protein
VALTSWRYLLGGDGSEWFTCKLTGMSLLFQLLATLSLVAASTPRCTVYDLESGSDKEIQVTYWCEAIPSAADEFGTMAKHCLAMERLSPELSICKVQDCPTGSEPEDVKNLAMRV